MKKFFGRMRAPREGSEFHLGQKEGFEEKYALAARSGSKYYLFWQKATDLTYAVGFDANDRVTYSAVGGT